MKTEIEQVRINKPQITVYYRLDDEASHLEEQPVAYLAGEPLTLDGLTTVAESGEAVEYEVLLDISGSLTQERFADVRQSLVNFKQNLRPEDTFALVTFGDEVTTILQGSEDPTTAQAMIEALKAHDQTTHLFDATRQIMKRDVQGKRAVVIISDGKDYADNNVSAQAVTEEFAVRGIPVYTMAVENKEGDTETQIGQYRAAFSQMATSTGGLAWSVPLQDSMNVSVADFLTQLQDAILGERVAQFHSATNQVSMSREDLLLEVGSDTSTDDNQPANVTAIRSVLVNTWQKDTVPPMVERIQASKADFGETNTAANGEMSSIENGEAAAMKYGKKNTIGITYSEPVAGADICGNYELSLDGTSISVGQVIVRHESTDEMYTLVMSAPLVPGKYSLQIHGVTDLSQEKNALEQESYTIEVMSEQWPAETETELLDLDESLEESESEETWEMDWDEDGGKGSSVASDLAAQIGSRWPYLLAGLVLVGAVIALAVRWVRGRKASQGNGSANKTCENRKADWNTDEGYPARADKSEGYHERSVPYDNTSIKPIVNQSVTPSSLPSKNITIWIEELGKSTNMSQISSGQSLTSGQSPTNHPRERRDVTVRGELYIGRSSQCQVQVRDPLLSKQHVQISVTSDGKLQVIDFDSTNGTSLNGVEVKGIRQLCSGDRITAGNHVFTVEWR